jgi:hypothetical protein
VALAARLLKYGRYIFLESNGRAAALGRTLVRKQQEKTKDSGPQPTHPALASKHIYPLSNILLKSLSKPKRFSYIYR